MNNFNQAIDIYLKVFITLLGLLLISSLKAQSIKNYKKGHYYDAKGNKKEGLIYYAFNYQKKIKYRESEKGKRVILRPNQIQSFVMEDDSFTVIKNFKNIGINGGLHFIDNDFVEVIHDGKITLYKHYSTQGGGMETTRIGIEVTENVKPSFSLITYLMKKDGIESVMTIKKNKGLFISSLSSFFGDNHKLWGEITTGKYTYEDLEELVLKYNQS